MEGMNRRKSTRQGIKEAKLWKNDTILRIKDLKLWMNDSKHRLKDLKLWMNDSNLCIPVKNLMNCVPWMILVLVSVGSRAAELRWDGEANDGLWQNPTNWSPNTLPGNNDDVVIDNSYIAGSFGVTLGPGTGLISIRSLRITPSGANSIVFTIAPSNVEAPALRCSGSVYGLVLDPGGMLINESGASAGATIEVADSIRINNGGRYVHRTARSHAETVRSLSRAPGTEEGEFEFNIPVASSTISLSGQVFGRLRLSPGPNGIINYTGTGTNGLKIRSDLEIMPGVNLSLNLEGIMQIGRNLVHNGGVFNLASTARKLTVEIKGHFRQSPAAIITESGTAMPEIILCGTTSQDLEIKGMITNEVTLRIKNPGGVILKHPLSLSYKLNLEEGILTTNEHLITLQSSCLLESDAGAGDCFVNGKIEKKGLANASFLFPVGKGGARRWIQLHQATGDFVVEYMRSDPRAVSSNFGEGISHISALEYWSIICSGPSANATIELSFDNVNSGGITDLSNLRVAWFNGSAWQDAGNSATTGTPGSSGSVKSGLQNMTVSQPILYALASNTAGQNPLPITWRSFHAFPVEEGISLEWIAEGSASAYYQVETSSDGKSFSQLGIVFSKVSSSGYVYTDRVKVTKPHFYRVVMIQNDSSRIASKIISVDAGQGSFSFVDVQPSASIFLSATMLKLDFHDSREKQYALRIVDVSGRVIYQRYVKVRGGLALVPLRLPPGTGCNVFIQLIENSGNTLTLKTMVQ